MTVQPYSAFPNQFRRDIVARKRRTVAFCEVKWRATATERDWAVDERRLQRVARAA